MRLKQIYVMLLIINILALIGVVIIISEYQRSIKQLEVAYQLQHRSLILADELRQSSDDLTRMARTYVITGNEMFEKQFQMVLDIRNGVINRPKNYNRIYWDFETLDGSSPVLTGPKIALRDLMRQAGFPDEELELLFKSAQESDDLTHLEAKAMNAVKGIFQDENGAYTLKGEPDFELAAKIMHGEQYHKAKIAIMKPLDEFYMAFETRTQKQVNDANKKVKELENYVAIAVFLLIILVLFSFYILLSRIIHPLEGVKNSMIRLANNNMDTSIPQADQNDEVGEMISAVEVFKNNAIKLIESEQQNKLLLDSVGEGIFGLDKKGKITFLNPMASKLLGYESSELIGKNIYDTIDISIDMDEKRDKKLLLTQNDDKEFIKKDKSSFPINYVSTPIYNKLGLIAGSVVVFSDITERKKNEDQLKGAIENAKAANHSKSVFLANMSHELRTPLNAILGFTDILEKSNNLETGEKENLNIIQNSGKHLLTIINEILEFSKIEAGKIEISPNKFNLNNTIDDVRQMFVSRFEEKSIAFDLDIKKDIPKYIECDELRLKQIIINLLANSLKFTKEGKVNLLIDYDDEKLYICVKDTGVGISKENQKLIFKPFEQIQQNKYTKKGTGLGLAITKELVNAMDGEIKVESQIDLGSEFSFSIKYEKVDDINIEDDSYKEVTKLNLDEKEFSILVVDDIYENRQLLVQNLNTLGLNTIEANDGSEVLGKLQNNTINLIFLDMLMPNLSGIETIKLLKNEDRYKDIPIVMVSANVFKEDEENAYDAGADLFLRKPIENRLIIKALQDFLGLEVEYSEKKTTKIEQKIDIPKETLEDIISLANKLDTNSLKNYLEDDSLDENFKARVKEYIDNFDFESLIKYCQDRL